MVVIWSTLPPIGHVEARETLDAALAYAAYDQPIALLATGLACLQLTSHAMAKGAGSKDISKMVKALPLYEVEKIYVCQKSVERFNIDPNTFVVETQLLDPLSMRELLQKAEHVIRI